MSDLLILSDWLASHGVTLVGMESTGVFWKPVYTLLETEFECWLLNAQHYAMFLAGKRTLPMRPGSRNDPTQSEPSSAYTISAWNVRSFPALHPARSMRLRWLVPAIIRPRRSRGCGEKWR
jgi:hypothetical protein